MNWNRHVQTRFLLREVRQNGLYNGGLDEHQAMHRAWSDRNITVLGTEDVGTIESAESFYDSLHDQFVFRFYGEPLPPMEPILPPSAAEGKEDGR